MRKKVFPAFMPVFVFQWVALIFFPASLTSCAGLVQTSGEILEGSAFEEKAAALYRSPGNKGEALIELKELNTAAGGEAVEITSSAWPGFALRGSKPAGRDGNFQLNSARVLSSHVHGWNEFSLDILGNAFFWAPGGTVGNLRIAPNVERIQISSGKIRLKSSRLTGQDALTLLRNRRERILAVTEWMQTNSVFTEAPAFENQNEFEAYWKPRLLPETVPRKKRPAEYSTENAEWGRADSVKWNKSYTEFLLPEELWELRNSGALLRDWEEALPWIYTEYSWDRITASFNGTILHKID